MTHTTAHFTGRSREEEQLIVGVGWGSCLASPLHPLLTAQGQMATVGLTGKNHQPQCLPMHPQGTFKDPQGWAAGRHLQRALGASWSLLSV